LTRENIYKTFELERLRFKVQGGLYRNVAFDESANFSNENLRFTPPGDF
jgi:hypothetical protein